MKVTLIILAKICLTTPPETRVGEMNQTVRFKILIEGSIKDYIILVPDAYSEVVVLSKL